MSSVETSSPDPVSLGSALAERSPEEAEALRRDLAAAARYRPLVDDWPAFAEALTRPLPSVLWLHPSRAPREVALAWLAEEGLDLEPVRWVAPGTWTAGAFRVVGGPSPGDRPPHLAGLYHIQEEASLVPVPLLGLRPGHRVLDLCAAPGGKTAQMALAAGNRGTVVANDRDWRRAATMGRNLNRLGLVNVSSTTRDAAGYPALEGADRFHRVLADVPCSCEGTSRKYPGVLARAAEHRDRVVSTQVAILDKAVRLCRPGGRIVYSTCTYAPEENEAVVDTVLKLHADRGLRLVPARVPGFVTSPGITRWQGRSFAPGLEHALRVWPHLQDTGGFFAAVLELPGDGGGETGGEVGESEPGPGGELDGLEPEAEAVPEQLLEHFAFPETIFEGRRVVPGSKRRFHLVAADHRAPGEPRPDSTGLPLVRSGMRHPKLCTEAALALGGEARRQVVELDRPALEAYLARRSVEGPGPGLEVGEGTGPGQVVVRHRGVGLGMGVLRPARGGRFELESLFPKRWAVGD